MNKRVIKGHIGIGNTVTGEALAADNFSARYDLDRINGTLDRVTRSVKAITVRSWSSISPRAEVATAWMLQAMRESGVCPVALLLIYA